MTAPDLFIDETTMRVERVASTHYDLTEYVKGYRKQHPDRLMLQIDGKCILPDDELLKHCDFARKQPFLQLDKAQLPPYSNPVLIVGSGLSVRPYLDEIRTRAKAGEIIMALKGAHDWLIANGVTPTYAVASDPQQSRHDCFRRLSDDVIYLLASQMHPDTWGYMRERKVILWHSEISLAQRAMPDWQGVPLVPGGCTTGLRALSLAYILGFRDVELYGFDSCIERGVYKVDGSPMRNGDQEIEVFIGDERFLSTVSLVPQVACLMATLMPLHGIKVQAHGKGYFQSALKLGKEQGWPV